MAVYDYQPVWSGAWCDPAAVGGKVERLDLYAGPERTGPVVATAGPAVRVGDGRYRFTLPDSVADGRYWCTVSFYPAKDAPVALDRTVHVDLPRGNGLIVSAEEIAEELGVALPITAVQREHFWRAIRKAQADVTGYLGRPIVPAPRVLPRERPVFGYDLDDSRAWLIDQGDDVVTVVSHIDNLDGTYGVQILTGLDGASEEPIRRYVIAHAAETVRNDPALSQDGTRRVTSVSAEGQSISYDSAPLPGQAGSAPSIDSLSGYRRRLFRPIAAAPGAPWPYSGGRRYRRW